MKKNIILIISIFLFSINIVYAKETVKYIDCVDGDTIKVKINGEIKVVRLLAIDTPESVKPESEVEYYGKESSEYTCKKIKSAKKIELEYDSNSDKVDKYDRVLAWVFVDDKLLQEELVSKGYAKVAYLYSDYKYANLLKEKQELASAKGIGLWNEEGQKNYEGKKVKDNGEDDKYSDVEVIVVVILFLIITFITSIFKKKR